MIALLCVALNIFVLAVISCGTDHQLESAMITNTVHQVHKNLINVNFPAKPECLNFTPTQERLKSLCIPFMQIILCELPRGGQLSIHGNVVNVPADVNSVVKLCQNL